MKEYVQKDGKLEARRSRKRSFEQGNICVSYVSSGKTSRDLKPII